MRVSNIISESKNLNELEDATLRSYVKKAVPSADELAVQGDSEKADRRNQGITRAARKIGQKLVKQHTQGMHEAEHKIINREAVAALMAKKKELQSLLLSNRKIDPAVRTRVTQGLADLNARLEKLGIQINEESDYEEIKDTVTRSISHRIMHQHLDLIRDYGLDEVINAIDDQADFIASGGPLEEIGSSDISAWVRNVQRNLERYSKKKDVEEGKWFKTAYGWAGGSKPSGGTYKHPERRKVAKHKKQEDCPGCHSSDIKTHSDGEKECNHCHRTWNVQGVDEGKWFKSTHARAKAETETRAKAKARQIAQKVVDLVEKDKRIQSSNEPYRAAMYELGFESIDGSTLWDNVMDEINSINSQGVTEAEYNVRKDPLWKKFNPEKNIIMYKNGKHRLVNHSDVPQARQEGWKERYSLRSFVKGQRGMEEATDPKLIPENEEDVTEAQTDYQKRRQRERDVEVGNPVKRQPKNPQNDYFARRKKEKQQGVAEGSKNKSINDQIRELDAAIKKGGSSNLINIYIDKKHALMKKKKEQGVAEGKLANAAALAGAIALGGTMGYKHANKDPNAEPSVFKTKFQRAHDAGTKIKDRVTKETVDQGVVEGSKMARHDKLAKAPKPKNQQEYDAIEKYRKDLAQSYKPKKEQGVAEDSEKKYRVTYDIYGSNKGVPLYTNTRTVSANSEQEAIDILRKLIGGTNYRIEYRVEHGVDEGSGYIADRRKFFALRKKSIPELDIIINSATSSANDKELAKRAKKEKEKQSLKEMDSVGQEQLEEYLNEAEEHIRQAINFLRMASVKGRNAPHPFSGQLERYIIPHLRSWIDDEHQPGSIASLKRILFNEY